MIRQLCMILFSTTASRLKDVLIIITSRSCIADNFVRPTCQQVVTSSSAFASVCARARACAGLRVCERIGVRDGGGGAGEAAAPVCRHEFGQRVDIIRAKNNTCFNNTNLGSDTAVNGKKSTNIGSVTATPQNMDPGKCLLLPPPHRIHSGKTRYAPPNGCWPVRPRVCVSCLCLPVLALRACADKYIECSLRWIFLNCPQTCLLKKTNFLNLRIRL